MLKRINPASLYDSLAFGFSHATLQDGGRTLHLAGQVAWDRDGQIVGPGDIVAQTRQALANLKAVLAEVGATAENVVRVRTYVVDHHPDKLGPVLGAFGDFYAGTTPAPNTFIGVAALALPDFLVEIEATAAL
ncbi:RidA family protein [Sphingosinicella microcystinivorans]|uniref:RidA family protein n=1 Tax=Sphingosinicella microcystinivorans TaxID=335406 RepID=UPI0022F3AE20|nr:RidA family protein [Sphingosinicella microcystinivorans]WBX84153.1 RidA family protein [Sphingosinicella microcystinivorans]